jgi:hypothetical protein
MRLLNTTARASAWYRQKITLTTEMAGRGWGVKSINVKSSMFLCSIILPPPTDTTPTEGKKFKVLRRQLVVDSS